MDKTRIAQLRYKARTDLYWLATEILGADRMIERVHRPVAEFFVQKKPGKAFHEQEPPERRSRALYDPRGHFKTTMMRADIIQWLLNFPDIRIFLGAGKLEQASDSLGAIKKHFQANRKLRALFPEFCPPEGAEWGTTTDFTLPNRKSIYPEPSLMAFSLDSIKAGPHCDIVYMDDAVHQGNIGTAEQLAKTITNFNYLAPILDPGGYDHVIGTPYSDADLYAWLEDNDPDRLKFRRPAWKIVNPEWVEGTPLTEKDVELLFPEQFTFKALNKLRNQNNFLFNCQYLLDPTPRDQATFTDDLLTSHTLPAVQIPREGGTFQAWDIGFSKQSYSDFSVGATGRYDADGNLFILDLVVGKFSPHELVNQIAHAWIKWRPQVLGIEQAGGAQLMTPALDMIQRSIKKRFNIEWIPTSPLKNKNERIASLQPIFKQHKLYLSAAIPAEHMAELKRQFIKFPRHSHDDIPDAIAMLLLYRNRIALYPADDDEADDTIGVSYSDDDALLGAGIVG